MDTVQNQEIPQPEENEVENREPIGLLFDSINYYSVDELDMFISNLTHEQSMYCIIQACQAAFRRNIFTMVESEVLSKALRKITI